MKYLRFKEKFVPLCRHVTSTVLKELGTSAPTEVLFSYLNGGIEPGGFAALRAPRPFPLAAGPLQSTVIKELRGQEAAISFPSNPFRKRAFVGAARKRS